MADRHLPVVVVATTGIEEYQVSLLRGLVPVLRRRGLACVVYVLQGTSESLQPDFSAFLRGSAPAAMITTNLGREHHLPQAVELAGSLGIPAVVIGSERPGASCVRGDNVTGMRALMEHLLDERGVRRPALARGYPFQADSAEREAVYREELSRRGLTVDEELVFDGGFIADVAHRELRGLLQRRRDLDAVVACNDDSARGCITALAGAGLGVPDDVLVTGFDNDRDALQWPGLTTVDQDLPEQGRRAAEALVALLDGTGPEGTGHPRPTTVRVPSRLVVRDSTASRPRPAEQQLATALKVIRSARAYMAHQDAATTLTNAMLASRSLGDVAAGLTSCLDWFGFRRCFLAVRSDLCDDPPAGADGAAAPQGPAPAGPTTPPAMLRLLIDQRAGALRVPDPEPYPAHRLLPGALRDEFAEGVLAVCPLVLGPRFHGYLLVERDESELAFHQTVHTDLARALDAVYHHRALQSYASHLEETVERRTRELERRTDELQAEVGMRQQVERQLRSANTELHRLAMRDALTSVANRAAFEQHLARHWVIGAATHRPVAMLLVDVDQFKPYNDRYGHIAGDKALQAVAECLGQAVRRPDDLVACYGGEEFAVVLPGGGQSAGLTVAAELRAALAARAIPHAASTVTDTVTVSIGVAVAEPDRGGEPTSLVAAADAALYRAKQEGRDRVVVGDTTPSAGVPRARAHRN